IPILEPINQQEAYDMVHYGFDISEKFKLPVLIRITTRLAHSRSGVQRIEEVRKQNKVILPENPIQYVLLPSNARKQYKQLLGQQDSLEKASEESGFNKYIEAKDKSVGFIASGIAYNYLLENYPGQKVPNPVLKISQYPVPKSMVERICDECDKVYVLEEGAPFIEEMIRGILDKDEKIKGRLDGTLPRDGELNPNIVAKALNIDESSELQIPDLVVGRPPSLCVGCSHIDAFNALNEAISDLTKGRVFSDIGCYTLGALPPFHSINSCVDMGASITMAKGAADAGLRPAIAVIGDSTFTHSGMTGLLDAVIDKSPITIFILDNSTTGMTGGQPSHAFGRLVNICKGIGVAEDHIKVIKPLRKFHEENVQIMKEEIAYEGVSVVIPQRECIQTLNRRMREKSKQKQAAV
ncbi:thiamine pyrophosphate-dependent enzyme, partial [Bacteroidota bacterium]